MVKEKMNDHDLYIAACKAYYSDGIPIMSDSEFDALERKLRKENDPIVNVIGDNVDDITTDIDDDAKSIFPAETWDFAIDFVLENITQEWIATLKMDGVQARVQTGKNYQARSRGSTKNIWDYSKALEHKFHRITETYMIVGEVFVEEKYLPYLRNKYNTEIYKFPRSAAISLLRTPEKHDKKDLELLTFVAHNTDKVFHYKSAQFDWLKSIGINTPNYETLLMNSTDNIQEKLRTLMSKVDNLNYPSDGIVLEFNDLTVVPDVLGTGKYLSTQLALKLDKWGGEIHQSEVIGLELIPKKGNFGCVLLIQPVKFRDGSTQRRVNGHNIGIILREKIELGSIIKFRRKSNGTCVLIYGGESLNDI